MSASYIQQNDSVIHIIFLIHMVIFNVHFFLLHRACRLHSMIFSRILHRITKFSRFQVVKNLSFFFKRQYNCLCQSLAFIPILQACPDIILSQRSLCVERRLRIHLSFFDTENKFCIKTTPKHRCFI